MSGRVTTWTANKPFVAGYYWLKQPDTLGMIQMVKVWYDPNTERWCVWFCDQEFMRWRNEVHGDWQGPLQPEI